MVINVVNLNIYATYHTQRLRTDESDIYFLCTRSGKDVLQRFKDDHMEDYIDLLRDFEIKKRATNSSSEGLVTIKLPLALLELVDESKGLSMKRIVQSSRYADKVGICFNISC